MQESAKRPPNSLRALRRSRELTLEQLGEMIGTDASTVNKLEKSSMRLTDKWLAPLSKALGASIDEILASPDEGGAIGIVPPGERDAGQERAIAAQPGLGDQFRPAPVQLPARHEMPNDVPVYGTAAASHLKGAFQLEPGVIDYVRRPPALATAKDLYALYVEGSSMEPRYEQGDLVFVHPHRPARKGDTVIVQVEVAPNEIEASIGYLRQRTGLNVVIGKLNPQAEVQIEMKRVRHIHRVMTMNELFGV
ncbi:MAG: helix-turn-helix domain-containing protein [Mesorhizobium sp.]|nr:helix-turn-helix domain-containing protein [Mesorhizobium sp.]